MRRILIAASTLALLAVAAAAGDDPMAGYYGNTVVASGGMIESHTHYRADHTFDLTASAMGQNYVFKGTWSLANGQLCRKYDDPAPPRTPNPLCTPVEAHKVGDSWTMTMNGSSRTLTLKAGVQ